MQKSIFLDISASIQPRTDPAKFGVQGIWGLSPLPCPALRLPPPKGSTAPTFSAEVKPTEKSHPKFAAYADTTLTFFSAEAQLAGQAPRDLTIGEAVSTGLVDNETLGYFIARTALFLAGVGIRKELLRFRQHLPTEMAHYATDCWDAEIGTCYGWLESVGIADRACYDLSAHSTATGKDLSVRD